MAIRPQFRLSTILFTLALCAVLLGWWRDRQESKREIQESRREIQESRREIDSLQLEFYEAKVKAIKFDLNRLVQVDSDFGRNLDPRHMHRVLQSIDELESELEKYTSLIAKKYRASVGRAGPARHDRRQRGDSSRGQFPFLRPQGGARLRTEGGQHGAGAAVNRLAGSLAGGHAGLRSHRGAAPDALRGAPGTAGFHAAGFTRFTTTAAKGQLLRCGGHIAR